MRSRACDGGPALALCNVRVSVHALHRVVLWVLVVMLFPQSYSLFLPSENDAEARLYVHQVSSMSVFHPTTASHSLDKWLAEKCGYGLYVVPLGRPSGGTFPPLSLP